MQSIEVKFLFGNREFELAPSAVPEVDFFDDDEFMSLSSNYETNPVTQSVRYSLLNGVDDDWFASKGFEANASVGINIIGYGFHQRGPIYGIYALDGRYSLSPSRSTLLTFGAAMGFDAYRDGGSFKFPKNFENVAMEDRYRLHVAATPWSEDWLDPELSTHGYALLRMNGGVERHGFGLWLSLAYFHDFEDKATAALNSNKFVFEPALRYKYRSFTVYAGLNRIVDTETFGDIKDLKNYIASRCFFDGASARIYLLRRCSARPPARLLPLERNRCRKDGPQAPESRRYFDGGNRPCRRLII